MSNGNWRGDSLESSSYNSDQLATLEDFITQSQGKVSKKHMLIFDEASQAFLDNNYSQAETKFSWLYNNGHKKNSAISHNVKLSQQRKKMNG